MRNVFDEKLIHPLSDPPKKKYPDDDSEKEKRVDEKLIRPLGDNPTKDVVATRIIEGDRVEANYCDKGKYAARIEEVDRVEANYCPGTIVRDRRDGTYDIVYDDGTKENRVDEKLIRPLGGSTHPHSESSTSSPRNVHLLRSYEDIAVRKVDGVNLILPISGKSWEEELEFNNYLLFYSLSKSSLAKLKDVKKDLGRGRAHLVLCPGGKISRRKAAAIARALTRRLGINNISPTFIRLEYKANDEFKIKIVQHGDYFNFLNCKGSCCCCIDSCWFPPSKYNYSY